MFFLLNYYIVFIAFSELFLKLLTFIINMLFCMHLNKHRSVQISNSVLTYQYDIIYYVLIRMIAFIEINLMLYSSITIKSTSFDMYCVLLTLSFNQCYLIAILE